MAYQIIRSKLPPSSDSVLLCDTSASMGDSDTRGGRRRIDHLAEILADVLRRVRVRSLMTFDDWVREIPLGQSMDLPAPSGSTALHLALDAVGDMVPRPAELVLITDGEPNSEDWALEIAERRLKRVVITAYYVGPEGDYAAMAFLSRLARCGAEGSAATYHSLAQVKQLAHSIVLQITHDRK